MTHRRVPSAPPALASWRRVEELGRRMAAAGRPVHFQPTVAHRLAAAPAAITCLVAALTVLAGLLFPLPAIALLLALLLGAVRDADGGQGWLRRSLPRRPGWTAEIELQGGPPEAPTLLLWVPVAGRAWDRLGARRRSRVLLAAPALCALVAGLGLATSTLVSPAGRGLALAGAAGLLLCALGALLVLRPAPPLAPDADPALWVAPLAARLAALPLPGVRLLVLVGSEGALWHDDLATTLKNRRHRYDAERTVLLALAPGPGPLAIACTEGLVLVRPAPAELVAALRSTGLPPGAGRTGAARASRMGLRAIGLQGTEAQPGRGPERVEVALRSLARLLAPEPT